MYGSPLFCSWLRLSSIPRSHGRRSTWAPTVSILSFPSCCPSLTFHQSRVYRKSRLMKLDGSFFIARCTLSITGGERRRKRVKLTLLVFVINSRFNLPFRHTAMFHCSLKNSFGCILNKKYGFAGAPWSNEHLLQRKDS